MMQKIEIEKLLTIFIAMWDEKIGPIILDSHPKTSNLDLEEITLQVFQSFQIIFGTAEDVSFNRTSFLLPLKSLKKQAKILLDSIQNKEVRGGLQPFTVVLLVPEDYSSENLTAFDSVLEKIVVIFTKEKSVKLEDFFDEIKQIYLTEQFEKELDLTIDENYSFTSAANDFKMGISFYQKGNLSSAYRLLKKALLKFENDNQKSLIMEASFLIATILVQNKKYGGAVESYKKLITIANELQNQKYIEQGTFMAGFCFNKLQNYSEAISFLEKLNPDELQFVNKLQFNSVISSVYDSLGMHNKAIIFLEKAIAISNAMENDEKNRKLKSQLYYELGFQNYQVAIASLKTLGLKHKDAIDKYLLKAIENLYNSLEILKSLGDFKTQIAVYKLIGSIFEFRGEKQKYLENLYHALDAAEKGNETSSQIKIFSRILQINDEMGRHNEIISEIDRMFEKLTVNAFVDLYTIASFHIHKGRSLLITNNQKDALSEFLVAKNIYSKINAPKQIQIEILNEIIKIYEIFNDAEKIEYYRDLLKKIIEREDRTSIVQNTEIRPFSYVKELWIISDNGSEIFNYAPETKLDPDLLGGFMTAMQSFTMELSKEKLNAIVIGDSRYSIFRDPGKQFYILGRSSIKSPEESVRKILKKISDLFYSMFSARLDNFNGDIQGFNRLLDEAKKIDFNLL